MALDKKRNYAGSLDQEVYKSGSFDYAHITWMVTDLK